MPPARRTRRPLLALLALLALLVIGYTVNAVRGDDRSPSGAASTRPTNSSAIPVGGTRPSPGPSTVSSPRRPRPPGAGAVALSALPDQARLTVDLILAGGPFPYSRDGVVFNNLEHHLPVHPRGYYREYTVPTPGESDRGARRIIVGRNGQYYYTGNHYDSFVPVDVSR
ncbi:MAG: ribonuclease domain-containing protein [bacterium]